MEIQIQGYKFLLDLFVLPTEGLDIVLGVQWLLEFKEVRHNYITQTLVFDRAGEIVTLMGDKSLRTFPVSFQSFQAMVNLNSIHQLFELSTIDSCSVLSLPTNDGNLFEHLKSSTPPPIATLLDHYKHLFTEPTQLPSHRTFDHRIFLEPNSKPVNVRPYHYPHFQKTKSKTSS